MFDQKGLDQLTNAVKTHDEEAIKKLVGNKISQLMKQPSIDSPNQL